MYELPTSIIIGDKEFTIRNKGDYRLVLDCFITLDDEELSLEERVLSCLLIFYEDVNEISDISKFPNLQEAIEKMYNFFNCNEIQAPGMKMNYKLIDWEKDSQLICSAINQVANKEIRNEHYIHWWTFMAYFIGIGECTLSTILDIRYKIAKGKKLEKHESQFKRDNPQYFNFNMRTVEQKEADELARQLWNQS